MKDMMVKGKKARLTYINETPNHTEINPFRPNQTSGKTQQIIPDQITPKWHTKAVDHKKGQIAPNHIMPNSLQSNQTWTKSHQSFRINSHPNHIKKHRLLPKNLQITHQTTPNQTHPNITRPEWFSVICKFFVIIDFFSDFCMICSGMISCDFIEFWLGRCEFVLVWFDVV